MVDFVREWSEKTGIAVRTIVVWLGIGLSKFYDWQKRYGKVNEHNSWIPRDCWLLQEEKAAIVNFYYEHPFDGYRRLSYMMLDADIVAVSPSSVYRVLKEEGLIGQKNIKRSLKGTGFHQPQKAHDHWHIDISYINAGGTFYYLCSILDGATRYIVHNELKKQMTEKDIELLIQRAKEKFPEATKVRIISDNGPQFIANDFKTFIRFAGMTHVRTSPYYPQSNGKLERWHHSLKSESVRLHALSTMEEAEKVIGEYVRYYNEERLHSAIHYVTPADKLNGKAESILLERDRKLELAREERAEKRNAA